jgi:sigma-B regulation protein RsbU (phosphoserine phosphatase)
MQHVDLSSNPRIAVLMDMVRRMAHAHDARAVLDVLVSSLIRAYGPRAIINLHTAGLSAGQYRITRWLDDNGRERIGMGDPAADPSGLPVHSGGFLRELIAGTDPKVVQDMTIRNDPVVGDDLSPYGSLLTVPIFSMSGEVRWVIILQRNPQGFEPDEIERMLVQTNLIGTTIDNLIITKKLREAQVWIDREVDQIAEIQRALLPRTTPDVPGLSIATSYKTFNRAGGDYFDIFPICCGLSRKTPEPMDPWGIFIADASGHGPSAAVIAAMVNALLHAYPRHQQRSPSDLLAFLNQHLVARDLGSSFVTALFAIYDPRTMKVTYANAGQNPPLLKHEGPDGKIEVLDRIGGFPLGILEPFDLPEGVIELRPGQTLLLYTDGVVEERCENDTLFGLDRLADVLRSCTGRPECLVRELNHNLDCHQGPTPPEDDQTIVAIQVVENAAARSFAPMQSNSPDR